MMRSRALPAGFDITQALHAPFGASSPSVSTPVEKTETVSTMGTTGGPRPLTLDTFTQPSMYNPYHNQYTNQTGVTPSLGAFAFTPPQSATDTMSPSSALSNMSAFSFPTQESPRRQPVGGPIGNPSAYHPQRPPMPRLNTHERIIRPMGESAGSPLRTSMSYSGLHSVNMQQAAMQPRRQSLSQAQQHLSRHETNPSMIGSGPYGLGFTCEY